jgi:hypothetical protein
MHAATNEVASAMVIAVLRVDFIRSRSSEQMMVLATLRNRLNHRAAGSGATGLA